jgi:hypothetical protein
MLFRESNYTMELDEINACVDQRGFNPIALRTYNHYRKLERYGYQRYVPINQLDVETLRDPVWVGPLRSRYRPRNMKLPAQLILAIDDQVIVLQGETTQVSPVEVVLSFRDETACAVLGSHLFNARLH